MYVLADAISLQSKLNGQKFKVNVLFAGCFENRRPGSARRAKRNRFSDEAPLVWYA